MCKVARHHTWKRISTEELEAKLGIHDIRHYVHSRVLRYLGHVLRMDADRRYNTGGAPSHHHAAQGQRAVAARNRRSPFADSYHAREWRPKSL
jgi:hypothetical protein